jgi:phage FluMu protein Com
MGHIILSSLRDNIDFCLENLGTCKLGQSWRYSRATGHLSTIEPSVKNVYKQTRKKSCCNEATQTTKSVKGKEKGFPFHNVKAYARKRKIAAFITTLQL